MEDQHTNHEHQTNQLNHSPHIELVHSGADYLDSIVADMERQVADIAAKAEHTAIPQVRDSYERLMEVLTQCIHTLKAKSDQLRHELHSH